jgi:tetratricopeptide (TPR) repeat protein
MPRRAFYDMPLRAFLVLAALAAPALADDKGERALGRGYRLEVTQPGLAVIKGGQRATVQHGVYEINKVVINGTTAIDIDVNDISCVGTHHYRWTFAHLDARLANSAAFALHQKKNYKEAAEGFAKAASADPSWEIPAYNLASARTLLGDLDGAIAALASRLASDPVTTYAKISSDPELRPLLARKEVMALRAKAPGTAKLDWKSPSLAYSPERNMIAVIHDEHSWGASVFWVVLEIYDIKTHKLVASTPIVNGDETPPDCYSRGCEIYAKAKPAIANRVKQAETMLAELGFSAATGEAAQAQDGPLSGDHMKRKVYLPTAKLGVVAVDGTARVLRGNTELATATGLHQRLDRVVFLDGPRVFVMWSFEPTGEGCDGYPELAITPLAL